MAKCYLTRQDAPPLPITWHVVRVGTGPGRIEGIGFKTVREAKKWAVKWGHEIVTLKLEGAGRR